MQLPITCQIVFPILPTKLHCVFAITNLPKGTSEEPAISTNCATNFTLAFFTLIHQSASHVVSVAWKRCLLSTECNDKGNGIISKWRYFSSHKRFLLILMAYGTPTGVFAAFGAVLDVNLEDVNISQASYEYGLSHMCRKPLTYSVHRIG